jgi:hypothetical protein
VRNRQQSIRRREGYCSALRFSGASSRRRLPPISLRTTQNKPPMNTAATVSGGVSAARSFHIGPCLPFSCNRAPSPKPSAKPSGCSRPLPLNCLPGAPGTRTAPAFRPDHVTRSGPRTLITTIRDATGPGIDTLRRVRAAFFAAVGDERSDGELRVRKVGRGHLTTNAHVSLNNPRVPPLNSQRRTTECVTGPDASRVP